MSLNFTPGKRKKKRKDPAKIKRSSVPRIKESSSIRIKLVWHKIGGKNIKENHVVSASLISKKNINARFSYVLIFFVVYGAKSAASFTLCI